MLKRRFRGAGSLLMLALISIVVVGALVALLAWKPGRPNAEGEGNGAALFMHCAAGIRVPVELIAKRYGEEDYGRVIELQFGGSNTLLSSIEVGKTGDLYLSADTFYIEEGIKKGLVKEAIPVGNIRPVVAVLKGNPKNIQSIDDLLREDVRVALANPEAAAVGRKTRKLLQLAGKWEALKKRVVVFKPTVNEVANDVHLGAVDAAIVWDATANLHPKLEAVRLPELDKGTGQIMIGVLTCSKQPTAALRFARYLAARDKGLKIFQEKGFEPVEGDLFAESPEITFFCGSVNRRAVEQVIKDFEKREAVRVNTVYNGCGILTAQMKTIRDKKGPGFPDTYMACDRYYLETVKELFQEGIDISDTQVVIAVPKGNPKNIKSLNDLAKPGMKISLGQPDQCTIGVLTRQLLESEGMYEALQPNVATQTASSAMLVPTVTTGSVDATLAFRTDTLAESDKVDTILIKSEAAKAIQPFTISLSSDQKHLAGRLYQAIAESRDQFEQAGFHWRLEDATTNSISAQ